MIKTSKHIRLNTLLISGMFLLLSNVQAQSIVFSSDQWPKRWERAMQHKPMNGSVVSTTNRGNSLANNTRSSYQKVSHQGWGQQPDSKRHKRSRTPEYDYELNKRYDVDPLKQRYALPGASRYSPGYAPYATPGYLGNTVPAHPYISNGLYPGVYPGIGVPGMPYTTPYYMGPGLYPNMGYPGFGYPGMGTPW